MIVHHSLLKHRVQLIQAYNVNAEPSFYHPCQFPGKAHVALKLLVFVLFVFLAASTVISRCIDFNEYSLNSVCNLFFFFRVVWNILRVLLDPFQMML